MLSHPPLADIFEEVCLEFRSEERVSVLEEEPTEAAGVEVDVNVF